jgi:hypothetical protein
VEHPLYTARVAAEVVYEFREDIRNSVGRLLENLLERSYGGAHPFE